MKKKKEYLKKLDEFIKILQSNEGVEIFISEATKLKEEIENFKVKVPLIGRFSAGKSRLLNTYLDENILEWSDSPTTSIATELHYGENEKIKVHYLNGDIQEKAITEIKDLKSEIEKISFIELYLNNPKLKEISEIVLVDMPGIESNNFLHTKAITNYVSNGHYFVAVAAPVDAFNNSLLKFIDEFANYGYESFSFILTRKKTNNNIDETQKKLSTYLKERYHKDIFVGATEASKLGKDIEDFNKVIEQIKSKLDTIFLYQYERILKDLFQRAMIFLKNKLKGNSLTVEELNMTILEVENLLKEAKKEFLEKLDEVKTDFMENVPSTIIKEATTALTSNKEMLLKAYKSGTIQSYIENLVRPIIITGFKDAIKEAESKISGKFYNLQSEIDLKIDSLLESELFQNNKLSLNDSEKLAIQIVARQVIEPVIKKTISKTAQLSLKGGFAALGAGIGTLAGPVGTLIGMVVGELVSDIIMSVKQNSNYKKQLDNFLIPKIMHNIKQSVNKQAEKIYSQIYAQSLTNFDKFANEKMLNLDELKKDKQNTLKETEKLKEEWTEAIKKISNLL